MTNIRHALAGMALCVLCSPLFAASGQTDLDAGFLNPPDSAKPQTWWHWMNGNITKEGITADLEAMKQIGLGGATIVNVDGGIPRGNVPFMSPQWREDFKFAVQEANRLGLDLSVENCAGWSSSGGPWNTPEHAMQQVVSSEVRIDGPTDYAAALPQPEMKLGFYRDIAVLAYPVCDGVSMDQASPTASDGRIIDGRNDTFIKLPSPRPKKPQFVQIEFKQPFAARTVKIVGGPGMPECDGTVLVSNDGRSFRKVMKAFAFGRRNCGTRMLPLGAEPVSARFWRVQFDKIVGRNKTATIPVAEIGLEPYASVAELGKKLTMEKMIGQADAATDTNPAGTVQRRDIIDLTSKLAADGTLNWHVPAGKWVVLRFGYTPTGMNNHPAPKEGTGLECGKLDKTDLDLHWDGFMQKILDDIGPLAGKALTTSLIDSYEVGGQDWTRNFRREFQKKRGYDLLPYLPAFTGRVVDNPAETERFLWDLRRTIADLFAENYFGHFAELCREHGLLSAVEPYSGPFESMQSGAPADIVMGEFWSGRPGNPSVKFVKLAASIAHVYGKTIIGAESFTARPENGRWTNDPYSLKALGDLMFCQGLNRYIFHTYAMQPWTNRFPGMTMSKWGSHFDRTETWWSQGKEWIDCISRCEFLLQQGRTVQDAAYFTGESAPVTLRDCDPTLPDGYDYDAINADVLLHGATVEDGRITLASGANYAVLVLPSSDINMTPRMLECIRKLVRDGATVIGPRPNHSPSLAGYPACDAQVEKMADELWGPCDGKNVLEHACGKGRIAWGKPLADIFAEQKLQPDFQFAGDHAGMALAYGHRVAGEADIYFVSNQRKQADVAECTFRVGGKIPELWHPDTGTIERAPVWQEKDGRTTVRLALDPAGSVFVIFRAPVGKADHLIAVKQIGGEKPVAPKLEILNARYEAVESGQGADVTAKLAGLVKDGVLNIRVGNDLFGDPAVNKVKQLRVEYNLAGQSGECTATEHERLDLGIAAGAVAPPFDVALDARGQPVVRAAEPCTVELKTAAGKTLTAEARDVPKSIELAGPWELRFPPNWGAPASITLGKLASWTKNADDGVKYFSGTATYAKTIEIPAERLQAGRELWLDLGRVKNFAEVSLNGQPLGILWKPPFRANLTAAAKPGSNQLEIKVTNLWPNRLIGDEQLPPDSEWNGNGSLKQWPQWLLDGKPSPTSRLTFTTWHHWKKDDKPLESGLIGPVRLVSMQNATRVDNPACIEKY